VIPSTGTRACSLRFTEVKPRHRIFEEKNSFIAWQTTKEAKRYKLRSGSTWGFTGRGGEKLCQLDGAKEF
jgi:hypothetical protein